MSSGSKVVQTFPYGQVKVIVLDISPDGLYALLQPDDGWQWLVMEAWGYHNDTVARSLHWEYYGPGGTAVKTAYSLAAGIHLELCRDSQPGSSLLHPLMLDRYTYAVLKVDALTSGMAIGLRALVLEFAG